jgi:hypothetical protein
MASAWLALFGAAFVVAACWAAGTLLIGQCGAKLSTVEKFPLAFVSGAACLHLAVFAIMAAHIAYKPVWLIALGALIVWGALAKTDRAQPRDIQKEKWPWIVFAPIFATYSILYLANAWAPETSPDGPDYHLQFVARYLRAHGFERVTSDMLAGLGQGVELLYAPAFALGGHSAAALVHLAFLIALAWAIFAYGIRIGRRWIGAAAAVLVFASPIVGRDGTTAYVDVAAAAIVFAVFYWLEVWDEAREARLLLPIGLLAGYAYAAKYTAFIIAPYALAFVAWQLRRDPRRFRSLITVAACATVMMAPWMIKDWIFMRNPVAPFANELFPNPYVHVSMVQQLGEWLRTYGVPHYWDLPMEVTARGELTQGIIGPVFLLAPLALLALRRRAGWRVVLPGMAMLAVYFGNVGTRFLIPCLPFFAVGIALALENTILLTVLALMHAAISWPSVLPSYARPYVWRLDRLPYQAALRIIPQDQYLRQNNTDYVRVRMIEEKVPPGERVFSTAGVGTTSYTSRDIIQPYRGALGNTLSDILSTGWYGPHQATRELVFHWPEQTVSRIRLLQTAQAQKGQEWIVHELRLFDRGTEVRRKADWRLRAWPNPFEIQLAFDNSRATRWRSWQTAGPGMYIEVAIGHWESVDELRMETSADASWPIQLRVECMQSGRWVRLAGRFEERRIEPQSFIRRAATYELAARGVHYVEVGDRSYGVSDYYEDPEAWGFEVVARGPAATIFRIVP